MAKKFLISAEVDMKNEIRVTYDNDPEGLMGRDYFIYGPRGDRTDVMNALLSPREVFDVDDIATMMTLRKYIKVLPPLVDQLVEMGYDKETLIFSIQKKDAVKHEELQTSQEKIEDIREKVMNLSEQVNELTECKGVYVVSDDEVNDLQSKLCAILEMLPH